MKKLGFVFGLALLLGACVSAPSPRMETGEVTREETNSRMEMSTVDTGFEGYIEVTNSTGFDIYFLYISHEDSSSWEEDVLGDEILWDGDTVRVDVSGYPSSIFDVRAEDEDGDTYTSWGVDIALFDVELTLNDLDL